MKLILLVKLRDLSSMPSLCAGIPLFTTQYAPNTKRRGISKSLTNRAYGAVCPVCTPIKSSFAYRLKCSQRLQVDNLI